MDVHRQLHSFTLTNAKVVEAIRLILEVANVSAVVVDETTLRILPKQ